MKKMFFVRLNSTDLTKKMFFVRINNTNLTKKIFLSKNAW